MKQYLVRFVLLVAVVVLGVGNTASAQTGTTSLRGTVTDKSGAAVADAKVTLANPEQGVTRDVVSKSSGDYEFVALPPGTYILTVEKTGFRKFEQRNMQLLVNNPATANVTLEIGIATETVEVSAQAAVLNTTDASLGVAFNENQVKQLPLEGRNVPDLLTLQAGVAYTGNRTDVDRDIDTRSGAVNGARSDQSNVTLDGVPVNDKGGHAFTSVLPVTLDSVQEFRVTTTNYNSDQGSSSGAQVSLVTKSGTNDFHGSLYEYHRNTLTSSNDFFLKTAELNNGNPNKPPKLIRNIFGGAVGGPIKKDRFYFFLNYEGTRRAEAASANRTVPTASLRDGVVQYLCQTHDDGSLDTAACPGGSVQGLSGTNYTVAPGYYGLSPTQITNMDPLSTNAPPGYAGSVGPNPAVVNYFNSYPLPNDSTVGDGVNYSGYRFPAPISDVKNWYIAKLDYNITRDAKHRLSLSGALANENTTSAPFLPGTPPEYTTVNFNKGLIANYSGVLSSSLVNNFRYGFIRQSLGNIGDSDQSWIYFRGIDQGVTRTTAFQRPIHSIADDLSWTHGKHLWQFGFSASFIRNPSLTTSGSFSDGIANGSWIDTAGFAQTGSPFDPAAAKNGYPGVDGSFANSYDFPMMALLGMVSEVDATYNFQRDGSTLPQGAPVQRHFAENGYELYAQDTWKVKPNLTLTLGLRYSLFSPPWETKGLQVSPTFSLNDWFNQRHTNMLAGIPSNVDPAVSFDWSGPANGGKKGYYNWDYHNLGPRIALAYSPKPKSGLLNSLFGDGKSTIRAGFGIVYDRLGEGLLDTFDSNGSFGLATTLTNPAGLQTAAGSARLTNVNTIPTVNTDGETIFTPAPEATFPLTFPNTLDSGGFAIAWGLDDHIKTPYSYTIDLSFGRELGRGFSLEVSYVGRLSHRLLAQSDLAMPLDLKDPQSGVDYFAATKALAQVYRTGVPSNQITASTIGSQSQYWMNMLQPLNSGGAYSWSCGFGLPHDSDGNIIGPQGTSSPIQAMYDLFACNSLNETTGLFAWDYFGIPDSNNPDGPSYFPIGGANSYFNSQYSSLYAWRTNSNANYHALQVNFRHAMSHGVQFDFNYTFSKSIDIMSDAERIGWVSGLGGQIINSWDPNAMRAVSDFDATHQFNANWIAELPFGRNRWIGANSSKGLDAIIGGWQLSGLFRMTSGFPFNVFGGYNWPTNWELGGNAFLTGKVKTGRYTVDGTENVFSNGSAALDQFTAPFPGDSGARNQIRGQGFFNIDMGLSKRWKMPWSETQSLQFRWEVFNVTNSNRFDVQSIAPELDISSTFGNYTRLATNPRVMQFALRYEF